MFKKDDLMQELNSIITESDARDIKEKVSSQLRDRNVPREIILLSMQIIMQNAKVDQLLEKDDIKLLYIFTVALCNATNQEIDLSEYFTKQEIIELKDYKYTSEQQSIFPIVITDVNQINDHHWEGVISSGEMHRLNEAKIPFYNPNTQRNPKVTKKGLKINVDPKKVVEIKESLLSGEYETDAIIWNVVNTGDKNISYNPKARTLTIYEGAIVNIVDGMHRKESNSMAVMEAPSKNIIYDVRFPLSIFNVSEIKAHAIMVQKNKQTKMPDAWIETKDYTKKENDVISKMSDERCAIFKIMIDDNKAIKFDLGLVKKSSIALAIKEIYEEMLEDNDDRRQLARWLSEFFDFMLKTYSYNFIELQDEYRKDKDNEDLKNKVYNNYLTHKNMFFGYISLSKELYGKDDWRTLLKEKMSSIDFQVTNPVWTRIGMENQKDASLTQRKKLYNLFSGGGIENV